MGTIVLLPPLQLTVVLAYLPSLFLVSLLSML